MAVELATAFCFLGKEKQNEYRPRGPHQQAAPEDRLKLPAIGQIVNNEIKINRQAAPRT